MQVVASKIQTRSQYEFYSKQTVQDFIEKKEEEKIMFQGLTKLRLIVMKLICQTFFFTIIDSRLKKIQFTKMASRFEDPLHANQPILIENYIYFCVFFKKK